MTRTEAIQKVKELGIQTERPAHQTATAVLVSLIHRHCVVEDHKARGRKIDPSSARQQKLAARAILLETGAIQKGRKINPTSARQQRLLALEAKRAAGLEVKRGRPKVAVV
jgi:ribosomal protein S18